MNRYLISYKYNGSFFHGFQKQKALTTVQGELEKHLSLLTKENINITGSGRLDKGVHAIRHYSHFDTTKNLRKKDFKIANIYIKKIKKVDNSFHARFSVIKKEYVYIIKKTKEKTSDKYYPRYKPLDIKNMRKCAKYFEGIHNFKNFTSGFRHNYTGEIYKIKIKKLFKKVYITVEGKNFFLHQVRNIVGALIDVGKGRVSINIVNDMIDNPKFEKRLSTAIAGGLYLRKVVYCNQKRMQSVDKGKKHTV